MNPRVMNTNPDSTSEINVFQIKEKSWENIAGICGGRVHECIECYPFVRD